MELYPIIIFTIFGLLSRINGQLYSIGCPPEWVLSQDICYKFVEDAKIYEEADAACWSMGARLLSTETYQEHKFVSEYLMDSKFIREGYYYTSGYYFLGRLYWEALNQYHVGQGFWIGNQEPPSEEKIYRVVYKYTDQGYMWSNITASVPASYICEIPRSAVTSLDIMDRDFDYGQGRTDNLKAERGPVIVQQPENIIVFDGVMDVEVECAAAGDPYPTYLWYRGKNFVNKSEVTSQLDNRYTITGGKFTIEGPDTIKDQSTYHCKAENKIGAVLSEQAQIMFGYLGQISNVEPEPLYASVFRGTTIDCETPSYSPRVSFQWFKNAATNIFVWPGNSNMFVSYSGGLYVSEVQPTDGPKRYFCLITLMGTDDAKLGKANTLIRSNKGILLLLSSDSSSDNDYGPILHTHVFPSPTLRGNTIRMECIAYGSHPLYYSWRREDGRPFVKGTVISARSRVLTITDAPMEADGNYICTCTRKTGAKASKIITLTMESKPYFPYPIRDMLADPGMTLRWNCKAVARPSAVYAWYKNGILIKSIPGKIEVRGNILTIMNVDRDTDEGMYQCSATNQHGTAFSTGQLKVLSFAPNFNRYPMVKFLLAPLNGNMSIPCGVEAAPKPDVQWLKNGGNMNLMPGDLNGRIGMDIRNTLILTDIQYSDGGVYTCTAANTLGDASNYTEIRVMEGIVLTQAPVPTTVQVNRTAFLYCQASYGSSYDITYGWNFNGRPIDFTLSKEYIPGRLRQLDGLFITHAQYKHAGIYECEAITTLQSVKRSASLTVEGPPGAPAGLYSDDDSITVRSVLMIWTVTQSIHHGGPITGYDIEGETNYHPGVWNVVASDIPETLAVNNAIQKGSRTDQRAATVTNLIPNTSYRFRVRAINTFGRGQEASAPSSWVKIAQTAPIIAPRNVGGGGGSVGTLTITWDILDPSEHCGPDLVYYIYWKKESDPKTWKKEIGNDDLALKHGKYVITVGTDNYYLPYIVKIGAHNSNGHGPNSTVQTVFSAEGMPNIVPVPQDIETYNCTSVIVYWTPVPDTREDVKGRVAGYRIFYYADKYGEDPYKTEPDPIKNEIKMKDVYGQTDHIKLIGLYPNTEYYSRVQVFNGAGFGPKGQWRKSETANDPLADFPTHIYVYQRDLHSVYVKWRGVGVHPGEESVQGYRLRVWEVQADIRTAKDTVVGKVNEAVVGGLQMHMVYVLRVLGYSSAGDGSLSEAVYFSITGGPSRSLNIPIDPTVSRICFSDEYHRTCSSCTLLVHHLLLALLVFIASTCHTYIL
ncbi:Contactin 1 [Mactra antiquata]